MHVHLLGDRLFWAPIQSDPSKVLDLGTGTGIWAIVGVLTFLHHPLTNYAKGLRGYVSFC